MNKVLVTICCLLWLAGSAVAEVHVDTFSAVVDPGGAVSPGDGSNTGYDNGTWFVYQSDWVNQWFYDDPLRPDGWKWIDVLGTIDIFDPYYMGDPPGPGPQEVGWATVAINYTTEAWSPNPVAPPLPGDDENFIVRYTIFDGPLEIDWMLQPPIDPFDPFEPEILIPTPMGPYDLDGYTEILDYNPEWVSIDIMGYNFTIEGTIQHECVPEPTTLAALLLGGLALLRRRR